MTEIVNGEVILQATHGSPDQPLRIGDIQIPCYVLEDGRRVLVQTGMITALNMSQGTARRGEGNRLTKFISGKSIGPYINETTSAIVREPIKFQTPTGNKAYGYEATVLADICESVLQARENGKLHHQQQHIAKRCEILVRGFARVGIIALVDEVTGYQEFRARRALEQILEKFISEELFKWAKTFPDEFYREIFRLRGWHYSPESIKRPSYVGKLTNDIVYKRLAPGVLEELKRLTPKDDQGRRKHRYHQRLTRNIGHPKLREHLSGVIALMKASSNWKTFYRMIQRVYPKFNHTLPLPLYDSDGTPF